MSEDNKRIKTKECIQCDKFFECKGKPKSVVRCVNFVERKSFNGRKKDVY